MQNCVMNVCQPGNRLKSAGYVLYSSSTMLVLTIGDGTYGFTLDWQIGEFVLTHDGIQIPEEGKIYSFNEGNYGLWDESVRRYMDTLKEPERWGGKPYSVRIKYFILFHQSSVPGVVWGEGMRGRRGVWICFV